MHVGTGTSRGRACEVRINEGRELYGNGTCLERLTG